MPDAKTYAVPAHCANCDHDFDATIPFGQPVPPRIECPRCGCQTAERRRPKVDTYPAKPPLWPNPRKWEPRCAVEARGIYHRPVTGLPRDRFMRQAG